MTDKTFKEDDKYIYIYRSDEDITDVYIKDIQPLLANIKRYEAALNQAILFIEPIAEWERKNGCIIPNMGCEEIIEVIFKNGMIPNSPRSSRYTLSTIQQALEERR